MAATDYLELAKIRELIGDLDGLLGVGGNFWRAESVEKTTSLDTPEQIEDLFRDLFVDLLGLKVEGL